MEEFVYSKPLKDNVNDIVLKESLFRLCLRYKYFLLDDIIINKEWTLKFNFKVHSFIYYYEDQIFINYSTAGILSEKTSL